MLTAEDISGGQQRRRNQDLEVVVATDKRGSATWGVRRTALEGNRYLTTIINDEQSRVAEMLLKHFRLKRRLVMQVIGKHFPATTRRV